MSEWLEKRFEKNPKPQNRNDIRKSIKRMLFGKRQHKYLSNGNVSEEDPPVLDLRKIAKDSLEMKNQFQIIL